MGRPEVVELGVESDDDAEADDDDDDEGDPVLFGADAVEEAVVG